jgi:hypothetical protein
MEVQIGEDIFLQGLISQTILPDPYDAAEKALQLLRRALPDETWFEFISTGTIQFSGNRATYLISSHSQTKIFAPATRRCVAYACLQLSTAAPDYDRILAEYLLLKNDEDRYWRTANMFGPASDIAVLFLAVFNLCLLSYLLLILVK